MKTSTKTNTVHTLRNADNTLTISFAPHKDDASKVLVVTVFERPSQGYGCNVGTLDVAKARDVYHDSVATGMVRA